MSKQKIVPSLWFVKDAEGVAKYYASIFPDSKVEHVNTLPTESPSGPAGSVQVVSLTLCGQSFQLMSAGPHHDFNDAISFTVMVDSQAELDKYWNAILEGGGTPTACGWINDRYGVRWQITPRILLDMITSPDKVKAKRAADEMLKQVKLDIAKLEAAFDGR